MLIIWLVPVAAYLAGTGLAVRNKAPHPVAAGILAAAVVSFFAVLAFLIFASAMSAGSDTGQPCTTASIDGGEYGGALGHYTDMGICAAGS